MGRPFLPAPCPSFQASGRRQGEQRIILDVEWCVRSKPNMDAQKKEDLFAVFAEADGQSKPLIMTHLTFARLVDEVVLPYQTDQPFFIDGTPLTRKQLRRLKLIKQSDYFDFVFRQFHEAIRDKFQDLKVRQVYAEQYGIRLESLLREQGEDVTSQIVKAFDTRIKPKLKDYIPKWEELIKAALDLFVESMKALAK